ncbi:hypothetical protein CYFUS_006849 [Cystobacter fuscus]|uniref:DUF6603 domain-containing protein n=1 Tax=Cystobacter fuscus TaxID=43 RepID=A0A250JCP7_9BACT|nr:DUF6603 domain-containing protein [Cystobacter fuscus]ATB41383.1 hypothetical protein CYFUS_006849 [Cystobacter fuscus]
MQTRRNTDRRVNTLSRARMAMALLDDLLTNEGIAALLGDGLEFELETADGGKVLVLKGELAEGGGDTSPLVVTAELDGIRLTELDALTQLVGGVSLDIIPAQVPLANVIALQGFELILEQNPTRQVSSVTLELQSAEPWQIIDGQFALEELFFSITVKSPSDPLTRQVFCEARSTLKLDDEILLKAGVALPSMNVAVALPEGQTAPLSSLLAGILPESGDPSTFTLTGLEAIIQPREQSYSFAAEIAQEWEVVPGLVTLTGLGLDMSKEGVNRPEVEIHGSFALADKEFVVSASRSGGGTSANPTATHWVFEGGLAEDEQVEIGALVGDLTGKLGIPMPRFIEELVLEDLSVTLDNTTKNLSVLSEWASTGKLAIDSRPNLPAPLGKTLLAGFSNPEGESTSLRKMVEGISQDFAALIPDGLTLQVNHALFASWQQPPTSLTARRLFGVEVGAGLDLSQLPLVGQNFTPEDGVKLTYRIMVASAALTQPEVNALIPLFEAQGVPLGKEVLPQGVTLRGELQIGDLTLPINVPVQVSDNGQIVEGPGTRSGMEPQWFSLQKAVGPVSLERVGVKFDAGELWLLLDASLALGPLSLGLSGLSVSAPVTMSSPPRFHLEGLALDYRTPNLEIGGTLLRREMEVEGEKVESYDGLALLKAKMGGRAISLSAIGGYAQFQGEPSLFLYAVLGVPLGGPPFFFVEGLSAGFGVNRALTIPTVDKIKDFPLVREALSGQNDIGDANSRAALLQEKVALLSTYLTPSVGDGFLAVGVKFTSFKLLSGFALLTVKLGERFEVHVLGLANLSIPFGAANSGVDPIAQIELALKASFIPEEGFLGVIAQLTPSSYILSKDCKLTGGYAFYTWLAGPHAGDFVITAGGYHPRFPVPDHYPLVPRLGFNWRLGDVAIIKGGGYFALCAHAVMAGGSLEVSFESGDAHATFRAGADFLISWKPYHYDIELRVSISAGFGFLGDVDVSAALRLWGPDFGGYAEIDVTLFSFTIEFGDQGSVHPKAIGWEDFQSGFLPPGEEICTLGVTNGLLRRLQKGAEDLWVVNPKDFALTTDAFVPTKKAVQGEGRQEIGMGGAQGAFGIRPMAVMPDDLETEQWLRVTKLTDDGELDVTDWFTFTPMTRKVPSAVWGTAKTASEDRVLPPTADEPGFVEGVVTCFDVQIKAQPAPGHTENIRTDVLRYDTTPIPDAFQWEPIAAFQPISGDDAARRERLRETVGRNDLRDQLLKGLGFDPERDVSLDPESLAQTFVVAPQVQ